MFFESSLAGFQLAAILLPQSPSMPIPQDSKLTWGISFTAFPPRRLCGREVTLVV